MAKRMNILAILSALTAFLSAVVYHNTQSDWAFAWMITFATTAYHFLMRLLTGSAIHLLLRNRVDYRRRWFRVSTAEQRFYNKLHVKKWKAGMGTYDPKAFDSSIHTWDEIAQATCQAELVHEAIILLSFLPVLAAIPFGALPVFVITSLLSAGFDALFVIMQRYNRPRILLLIEKQNARNQKAIERIQTMELRFDLLRKAAGTQPESLRKDPSLREELEILTRYYESGQWLRDYELDEKGLLPPNLKRGVLAQDAVYDLLDQIRQDG
jgi:hypothetical protein